MFSVRTIENLVKIYDGVSSIDDAMRGAVLSVGNFDGVHLGHQRILRTAHALARVSSAAVAVMTFEPHPLAILRPDHAPPRLTPWQEKAHQLELAGADMIVRLEADRALLSLSPEEFVRDILVKRIHPSYIVEGPNFGFGRGRSGNVDVLARMSAKGGFQLRVAEPYRLLLSNGEHAVVSSTAIRKCLSEGLVEDAAACLGRPYSLLGKVVRGAGDGKKLGFPTINLDVGRQMIPADGVYAGIAHVAGPGGTTLRRAAAISLGCRPTLGGTALVVEAHVLEASGNWYDTMARLELIKRLREQIKFDSRQALTDQIALDLDGVRAAVLIG